MKVLIADDSPTVRLMAAARLRADGYEVLEAADGEEALRIVQSEDLDLLVLDKVMPGLDGFEVIRALSRDPRVRAVPIVMLTEHTDEADVLSRLGPGVREYMPKPFALEDLSVRVRRALRQTAR